MALLDKPLFGDEASGPIKSTLTFGPRRLHQVVQSVRRKPVPRTQAAAAARDAFSAAAAAWRDLSPEDKASWNALANPPLTGYNLFIKDYLEP